MNILDTIIAHKHKELAARKALLSFAALEKQAVEIKSNYSLKEFLLNTEKSGIIAEFKRKSPSLGIINDQVNIKEVTAAYTAHGASALSVLTDAQFFGGSDADLENARTNAIPILRKDFIIDEYQIAEAKKIGANVVLLIAACLSPARVSSLAEYACSLGLEVLLELHNEEELMHICDATTIVGINNRDLKTFKVDIERSLLMATKIPVEKIKVAESGINSIENIRLFKEHGFKGFLVGEHFMKTTNPGAAFKNFVISLNNQS
ncbi:MAG: indole-3-glycerol phosphate synthase TrpC [Chitinophagaceae bacterium]